MPEKPLVALVDDDSHRNATRNLLEAAGFATATFPRSPPSPTRRSVRGHARRGIVCSLSKPFAAEEMFECIRLALDLRKLP